MTKDVGVEFSGADNYDMKTQKQWCGWAVLVAALAFMLYKPLAIKAQAAPPNADAQEDSQNAAQNDAQNPDQDPPSRVARLNYIDGSVSFQPDGANEWVDAAVNRPLADGDNLWADENSRAEVHIGSTALRLGAKTGITLLEVNDRVAQIRLEQGSLILYVHHVDDDDAYEIDTPNVAFVPTQPGDYRIDVDPDGQKSAVTVWHGRGEVTGEGSTYPVLAGQYSTFTGGDQGARVDYQAGQVPDNNNDALNAWALERDRTEADSDASNYVSRDMTGYEDLDSYGDWSYVAAYGYVWSPRSVVPGWAPYRYGNWTWVAPYGWTWVASEPWGFAPFHYGRWATVNNAWIWVPGPNVLRPVYAPAVVGWVGGKFSSGPGVGWVPLAPGEVFVPGYHVSQAYVNRVNTTNTAVTEARVTNVYNTVVVNHNAGASDVAYANRNATGGVTVVSRDTFVNGRPVGRSMVSVPSKELASAPVSSAIAIEPAKASVIGVAKPATTQPPSSVTTRTVVALRTPAPTHSSNQNQTHQLSTRQLVRQQPQAPSLQHTTSQSEEGIHSLNETGNGDGPVKSQPRVWEAQGTPEQQSHPAKTNALAGNRNATSRQQSSHPTAKQTSAVQTSQPQRQQPEEYSSWHQQKTTTSSPAAQTQHATSSQSSHPAASSSSSTAAAPVKK
jgi:hypothetical protein